ncbi:MAG: cytochrome d ubiquinol oxidase subunit II [Actinomycetota bacterium]|nr:cytochrome d ubiquinol oxidase subunit II [Actinomycetota bacterium]
MTLADFWFILIAVLWIGYFVLEGFDFGVGILLPVIGRSDAERRTMINAIGPVWDGNEVWLLTAGGATFAAFPLWYATLFSGFYLALLIILLALIVRGVAFEFRGKVDDPRWRARWDVAIVVGSALPALLWGVAFGNIVRGVPVNADGVFTGNLLTLLNPYALLGGLTTLTLFALHGAVFLGLKTTGDLRDRARTAGTRIAIAAVPIAAAFLLVSQIAHGKAWTDLTAAIAAVALLAGVGMMFRKREGLAFAGLAVTLLLAVVTLFGDLFPNVLPSSTDPAYSLTVANASSAHYTLVVMTWVALIFTPVVLAYQAWSYWVFRKRLRVSDFSVSSAGAVIVPGGKDAGPRPGASGPGPRPGGPSTPTGSRNRPATS